MKARSRKYFKVGKSLGFKLRKYQRLYDNCMRKIWDLIKHAPIPGSADMIRLEPLRFEDNNGVIFDDVNGRYGWRIPTDIKFPTITEIGKPYGQE